MMKNTSFVGSWLLLLLFSSNAAFSYEMLPPPVKGSVDDARDFQILHDYQDSRTKEECEIADLQSAPMLETLFGVRTGVLTSAEVQRVKQDANKFLKEVIQITEGFKLQYLRPRPFVTDETLHPCIKIPGTGKSYPSGHATAGVALAAYLAKQFPMKRALILKQGDQVGFNRLIGGVHHPSDVAAGQSLGHQIAQTKGYE